MVLVTVKQPVRDIRVRRHVQVLQDQVLKVARCHYTDVFTNRNRLEIVAINVSALERFDAGSEVSVETLIESGIVKNPKDGVKILGNGELTKKLTVKANAFSASAKEKIEAVGGTCEVI